MTDATASPLAGKTALVTGASRGIGRATALRLAQLGARLLLVARQAEPLAEATRQAAAAGAQAAASLPCDLSSTEALTALCAQVTERYGCDILVNAAGIGRIGKPVAEMPLTDFDVIMATNLRAPFLLMQAVLPGMIAKGGGSIVNISSLAGSNPLPKGAAYSASKWGLNGLTYSVAEEVREHNIRVAVVAPGSVNTDFGFSGKNPERMLQAEDVAAVVAMLVTQPPQSFISEVRMRPTRKP